MKQKTTVFKSVRAMTVAAMLVTMSVVIGFFCKTYLNYVNGLFRITFENLPIIMSGLLFGPVVGGFVGAASDLVSYLLSPQTYPPNLIVTLGAAVVGIVSGVMAKYAVKKRGTAQIIVSGAAAHIMGSMIIKTIGLYQFYGILVLWRIPLYIVIASLEILVICFLFSRNNFRRLIEKL
ncbi:MAG: folate family ECF transporter S component [Clostridia bacterium]|nr:folate family ECF transporter S component [Clostridia bacterium]